MSECQSNEVRTTTSCCGGSAAPLVRPPGRVDGAWTDGTMKTPVGDVPRARTALTMGDHIGTLRARFAVGRMDYRVPPGLYAVGNPTPESPVLVSANYKMSFDRLRSAMSGRSAWILVIDTHGINVWCAAGKGTFGTAEVVSRVTSAGLSRVVSHRKLVLPQLAAPGVSAHDVRAVCGFTVVYGPVRAADLPAFLDARMKATPDMRLVRFGVRDRSVLIPVEMVAGGKYALLVAAGFLLLGGLSASGYALTGVGQIGARSAALLLATFFWATTLGPILLPWLPGRAFSVKGGALGLLLVAVMAALDRWSGATVFGSSLHAAAWALIVPAIASFVVMNFTGASTYTSLSGVLREMRFAVPAQIAGGALGLVLFVTGLFIRQGGVR